MDGSFKEKLAKTKTKAISNIFCGYIKSNQASLCFISPDSSWNWGITKAHYSSNNIQSNNLCDFIFTYRYYYHNGKLMALEFTNFFCLFVLGVCGEGGVGVLCVCVKWSHDSLIFIVAWRFFFPPNLFYFIFFSVNCVNYLILFLSFLLPCISLYPLEFIWI